MYQTICVLSSKRCILSALMASLMPVGTSIAMHVVVATVNVNGLRAAYEKGLRTWLKEVDPDVLTLQEVRAPDASVRELLSGFQSIVHSECSIKGRAGVLVASKYPVSAEYIGLSNPAYNFSGRWAQCDVRLPEQKKITVVSVYVPTGDATILSKVDEKMTFLDVTSSRLKALKQTNALGIDAYSLVTGDLNVAHTFQDLKNARNNVKNAGFLPQERQWLSDVLTSGWLDVQRRALPDAQGPYSFWSFRGRAFDNDSGWRVDYQLADSKLASKVVSVYTYKSPSYSERWSDHAPVVATYDV